MSPQGFDQTLSRFGLENLKGIDLQLTKGGDIALTRDGDLQLGNFRANGMFRFIERWRWSESTITQLFMPMVQAANKLDSLVTAREQGQAPLLWENPQAYHEATDYIVELQLVSSTLAGAIAVILNNLFQRLKRDLNTSDEEWHLTTPTFASFSIGEIFSAAATNFRHYDEWASAKTPSPRHLASMKVLCGVLNKPVQTEKGFPTIRANKCGNVLMLLTEGSIETLHQLTVGYAKSLAKYK